MNFASRLFKIQYAVVEKGPTGLSDQLIHDRREKIRMIPNELHANTDDLMKKYSIQFSKKPQIRMPKLLVLNAEEYG